MTDYHREDWNKWLKKFERRRAIREFKYKFFHCLNIFLGITCTVFATGTMGYFAYLLLFN